MFRSTWLVTAIVIALLVFQPENLWLKGMLLLCVPFLILGAVRELKKTGESPVWDELASSFGTDEPRDKNAPYKKEIVCFRINSYTQFDYHNVMNVQVSNDWIKIYPTFCTKYAKPLLIPVLQLERIEKVWFMLHRKVIYKVKGSELQIAI